MPITVPNLDDRSFDEILAEAVARIPVHTPEWNNFNDSDPGMTLVQLFAFMTENLLYRSNRIPEANRLKFLSLLGVPLRPPSAARGLVQFINDRGPLQPLVFDSDSELLAGKVPFRTRTTVNILPITTAAFFKRPRAAEAVDEQTRKDYESLYTTLASNIQFYQSVPLEEPQIGKPLPEINLATTSTETTDQSLWLALLAPNKIDPDEVRRAIAEQTLTLGVYPSSNIIPDPLKPITLEAQQVNDPGLIFEIPAPLDSEQRLDVNEALFPARYKRLSVYYAENVLEMPGIVQLILPPYDDLRTWEFDSLEEGRDDFPPLLEDSRLAKRLVTWIRIRLTPIESPNHQQSPTTNAEERSTYQHTRLTWVGVNAARVLQIIPVRDERLGLGTGTPEQSFKVANTPVILEPSGPGKENFILEIASENSAMEKWRRTDDLYAAAPTDPVFYLDAESGQITFGDGLRGKRPPAGHVIQVSYEYGGGIEGDVAIGAINKSPLLPGGFKVTNPVRTWGAARAENALEGEQKISRYLRHRDRLVTTEDFRDIAYQAPGVEIGRVEVVPLLNADAFDYTIIDQSQWAGTVTVMVVPQHPIEQETPARPDRLFLDAICAWLEPRRLITTEIYVRGPHYVEFVVSIALTTLPGYIREEVLRDVRRAIREYLSPLIGGLTPMGRKGTGWPLGTDLRPEDIEAVAVRVEGVRLVSQVLLGEVNAQNSSERSINAITEKRAFQGLELPWLSRLNVTEGTIAIPLSELVGPPSQPGDSDQPPTSLVVPLRPKKC